MDWSGTMKAGSALLLPEVKEQEVDHGKEANQESDYG
jgi:hypothetical protein